MAASPPVHTESDLCDSVDPLSESSNWRGLNGVGIALFLWFVWAISLPGYISLLLILSGLVTVSVWVLFVIRLYRRPAHVGEVVIGPLLLVALLVLSMWSLPLKARFALSKTAFEAVAEEIAPQSGADLSDSSPNDAGAVRLTQTLRPEGRIGSYDIRSVQWNSDDIYFYSQSRGNSGFVYLPNGSDQHNLVDVSLTPLSGDWYEFTTTS